MPVSCLTQDVTAAHLRGDERINHSIEIVEEWDEVECQFDPSLSDAFIEHVGVHDWGGVVQARARHHRTLQVSVDVIPNEREVKSQAEEFSSDEKEQVEEGVHDILRQNQWVQTVALVDRIFVVCLQLIEGYYVEDWEEYEECVEDEGDDVAESCKRERHGPVPWWFQP